MKVWDVQERKCIGVLTGHTGSVKSMCSHPSNPGRLLSSFVYQYFIFTSTGCYIF